MKRVILQDTFILSVQQLWANKLRAVLSLLGITIGIFSIIAILTAVDALKNDISSSINKLGDNIVFVAKWPWSFADSDYPWWEYIDRPEPRYKDYKLLEQRMKKADALAYKVSPPSANPSYMSQPIENVSVEGVTQGYGQVMQLEIEKGRFFSSAESNLGAAVAVIGGGVAAEIFKDVIDPIGREIQVFGRKVKVVGIIAIEGEGGLLGFNHDKSIFVTYFFANKVTHLDPITSKPIIEVRAKKGVTLDALSEEIKTHMRSIRKLRPKETDDFSMNRMSIIATTFEGVFSALNVVGWVIGFFALIVGGFGIANIMYVSVSERTNIIGIKKAMGARRSYILFEFLTEAILLCVVGGFIGLIMVASLTGVASSASGMQFVLSFKNAAIGIGISVIIGLISGYLPALSAANMDAVEAIRSK
jgi:putative ABC transport system permease protein